MDGDRVLYEKASNGGSIYYLYDVDGTLFGFNHNAKNYLYIRNIQGDITKIVDEQGNIVVEYTYNAWGTIIDVEEFNEVGTSIPLNIAKINPYRYRGYRYDEETGWYYLNSRYYNSEIGRFINADGLIGETGDILGHNMYAYTKNNPVMRVDPSGYDSLNTSQMNKELAIVLLAGGMLLTSSAVQTVEILPGISEGIKEIATAIETEYSKRFKEGYYVYQIKNIAGEVIYVGITRNKVEREDTSA